MNESKKASEQEVREVFNHFDKNGNGTIEARELKAVLAELGQNITDEQAADLVF